MFRQELLNVITVYRKATVRSPLTAEWLDTADTAKSHPSYRRNVFAARGTSLKPTANPDWEEVACDAHRSVFHAPGIPNAIPNTIQMRMPAKPDLPSQDLR